MRSIKLVPALVAAAMLLALAPAGASGSGKCRIKLEAPTDIIAGESAKLQGNLECPSAAAAVTEVTIRARPRSGPRGSAVVLGTVKTVNGTFELTATPPVNTVYFASAPGALGAQKAVLVSPAVSFGAGTPPDGSQLITGQGPIINVRHTNAASHAVTFTGTVTPSRAGQIVVLQREFASSNEEWRVIDFGRVNANHEFTIKHIFHAPGDANIRVLAEGTRANAAGATEVRNYVISQPQNPNLTINVSKDPISFGEKVEISGVAKGVSNGPVTLLGRNIGGKFAPVGAPATTDSSGNYKFTVTPEKNTLYRVSDATANSAFVFEGVRYVLTPGASPSTTVQAGTPLTFSGKVTPKRAGLAGHPIYLERQGAAHLGWGVVEVGQVNANGEYSISRAFFIPGEARLRVKIPGDPENEGVSTLASIVTITPAPPGTLRPELPNKKPGEGRLK